MAARVATLPEAHAASCREAGVSHNPLVHGGRHGTEVSLPGEHLAKGISEVYDVDLGRLDFGRGECRIHHLGGQFGEVVPFAGEIAGEIALIPAEDPDVGAAHDADGTTTKRVTPGC